MKLCECGCGQPTEISKSNRPERGIVKGQPTRYIRGHSAKNNPERSFLSNTERINGCLVWTGCRSLNGYGRMAVRGRSEYAHRYAYQRVHGEIPDGFDLDHLCRNRPCVDVAHLELVTRQVNLLRGETITAKNAAKTHCINGHEYTDNNTYRRPTGSRECRRCIRERKRRIAC